MPYNDDETFTQGSNGGVFPVSGATRDNPNDFENWDWKQIRAAVVGYAATGEERSAPGSDPDTLYQAATAFYRSSRVLDYVAQNVALQAEELAGPEGAWNGPAAKSFRGMMDTLAAKLTAKSNQISGGISHTNSVPVQLHNSGNYLAWAKETIVNIDSHYASWVGTHGRRINGLAAISDYPQLVAQMTEDMRKVVRILSTQYVDTYDAVVIPDTSGFDSPGPSDEPPDGPPAPDGPPTPDPPGPPDPPPSADVPPPPEGPPSPDLPGGPEAAKFAPPDIGGPSGGGPGVGGPPPSFDLGAGPGGGPDIGGAGSGGLGALPPFVPLSSLSSSPPSFNASAPGIGGGAGVGRPAPFGVSSPDASRSGLPASADVGEPADSKADGSGPASALGLDRSGAGAPPMMPPMSPPGAGGQGGVAERPDSAGLLGGEREPWTVEVSGSVEPAEVVSAAFESEDWAIQQNSGVAAEQQALLPDGTVVPPPVSAPDGADQVPSQSTTSRERVVPATGHGERATAAGPHATASTLSSAELPVGSPGESLRARLETGYEDTGLRTGPPSASSGWPSAESGAAVPEWSGAGEKPDAAKEQPSVPGVDSVAVVRAPEGDEDFSAWDNDPLAVLPGLLPLSTTARTDRRAGSAAGQREPEPGAELRAVYRRRKFGEAEPVVEQARSFCGDEYSVAPDEREAYLASLNQPDDDEDAEDGEEDDQEERSSADLLNQDGAAWGMRSATPAGVLE